MLFYESDCCVLRPQEAAGEALLPAGRGVETGSLHKHSSSSRKLGRQEGDGALGSLGLGAGKSKLKDKLSAIRQDRAERRESLQKQDAIHEVDSSEDETDEGSEDSQDGRRGATFTPPPLLRPTTVRTGPGGTLPSLCLSPCTPHATFSHTGPSRSHSFAAEPKPALSNDNKSIPSTEEDAGKDGKVPGAGGASQPPQRPLPFATPGSAFISVSKDSFLRTTAPDDSRTSKATCEEDGTSVPSSSPSTPATTTDPTTGSADFRTPGGPGTSRSSCSSPGISKEKKEADNRRLCAAAAALMASGPGATVGSPDPPGESSTDRTGSQITAVSRRLPTALDKKAPGQNPSGGAAAELQASDPPPESSETPAGLSPAPSRDPGAPPASEPKHKHSDAVTTVLATANATVSSQQDKAVSKKT